MVKIEDIPADVQWVWCIQQVQYPIGLDTLSKMHKIISANPKYFPWETKYDSIPKEVHDAYWKEIHDEQDKKWAEYVKDKEDNGGFIGLIPTIMQMDKLPAPPPQPEKSLPELLSDAFKRQYEERNAEEEKYKKDKALWDKYYKPYGLEYRK